MEENKIVNQSADQAGTNAEGQENAAAQQVAQNSTATTNAPAQPEQPAAFVPA